MFAVRDTLKPVKGRIDPLAIARAAQPGRKFAVPWLKRAVHGESRPMQRQPSRAHFSRAARESMQDQDAHIGAGLADKVKRLVGFACAQRPRLDRS